MISILISVIGLLTIAYGIGLLCLRKGLTRLKQGKNTHKPVVSVVVAARNEEHNIEDCLSALVAQDYPKDKLEIVIVDDRSEDATAELVKKAASEHPQIKLLHISDEIADFAPKKRALDSGIRQSRGEIILTTDADCRPGPGWITGMIRYFEPQVGLVAGFSPLNAGSGNSFLKKILTLDALSLACVAAGSIGLGYALTCSGRNLAYRKAAYFQVGGFQKIGRLISGDDDLFLHLIRDQTSWQIQYATDPATLVPAKPPLTFGDFFHQRIRHASKGTYYSTGLKIGLITIYLYNLLLLALFICSIFIKGIFLWFVLFLAVKAISEFLLILKGARLFHVPDPLLAFPLAVVLHPLYVAIFGVLGQWGQFHWKGGKFRAKIDRITC